ncbi:ParA family protein [Embleya sp. NPDC059237]|uniref:ParA family protein n=1 Tax=Embleya sp. NPDC059237 TaxID=3346784 RepID=UPI0036910CE9
MLRVAIYSEKGGVNKTSLTAALTAVAAKRGLRVVAVDLDPRATLSEELGADGAELTLNDLLFVDPRSETLPADPAAVVGDVLVQAGAPWPANVRVIASERALAHREMDNTSGMEHRLARALTGIHDADLVLMDVPPRAGGRVPAAALIAADLVLIPAPLTTDGLIGAREGLRTIRIVSMPGGSNERLRLAGLVRSMTPRGRDRSKIHDKFDAQLMDEFGELVLPTQIPYYVVREHARLACEPVTAATGREARILVAAYDSVLDHLLKVGGA